LELQVAAELPLVHLTQDFPLLKDPLAVLKGVDFRQMSG